MIGRWFSKKRIETAHDPSKRKFMAAAAALPIAGPEIVREVSHMVKGTGSMHGSAYLACSSDTLDTSDQAYDLVEAPICYPKDPQDLIKYYKDNILDAKANREKRVRLRMRNVLPTQLCPDIAALRSFSGVAKARLQAERDIDYSIEEDVANWENQLNNALASLQNLAKKVVA